MSGLGNDGLRQLQCCLCRSLGDGQVDGIIGQMQTERSSVEMLDGRMDGWRLVMCELEVESHAGKVTLMPVPFDALYLLFEYSSCIAS